MNSRENTSRRGLDSDGQQAVDGTARQLSDIARLLQAEPDLEQTLRAIVEAAVDNIAGADFAGITLLARNGQLRSPAVSDDLVATIDRIQYAVAQGPCVSSAWERSTIRSDDLRSEHRWPSFAQRAADLGVQSMLAFQLYVHDEDMGALNLYARRAGAFSTDDESTGLLFASHAAIALVGAQHEDSLNAALIGRDTIGQAKGILMERYRIDAHAAFALLVRTSQASNRKLRDVAQTLATTGTISLVSPARPPGEPEPRARPQDENSSLPPRAARAVDPPATR